MRMPIELSESRKSSPLKNKEFGIPRVFDTRSGDELRPCCPETNVRSSFGVSKKGIKGFSCCQR